MFLSTYVFTVSGRLHFSCSPPRAGGMWGAWCVLGVGRGRGGGVPGAGCLGAGRVGGGAPEERDSSQEPTPLT